jgi:hypothetical protein
MLNDHLAIRVWNARKQVPYGRISLLVNLFLTLRYRLRHAKVGFNDDMLVIPKRLPSLLNDCLAYMMTHAVDMIAQRLAQVGITRLEV